MGKENLPHHSTWETIKENLENQYEAHTCYLHYQYHMKRRVIMYSNIIAGKRSVWPRVQYSNTLVPEEIVFRGGVPFLLDCLASKGNQIPRRFLGMGSNKGVFLITTLLLGSALSLLLRNHIKWNNGKPASMSPAKHWTSSTYTSRSEFLEKRIWPEYKEVVWAPWWFYFTLLSPKSGWTQTNSYPISVSVIFA